MINNDTITLDCAGIITDRNFPNDPTRNKIVAVWNSALLSPMEDALMAKVFCTRTNVNPVQIIDVLQIHITGNKNANNSKVEYTAENMSMDQDDSIKYYYQAHEKVRNDMINANVHLFTWPCAFADEPFKYNRTQHGATGFPSNQNWTLTSTKTATSAPLMLKNCFSRFHQ